MMTLDLAKLRAETLALIDGTTPGPWLRDCWDVLGSGAGTGTGSICEVAYPNGDDDQYWKHGEADANARLIAAAPTLAADTLRLLDEIERLRTTLEQIAKAKYGLQSIMEDYSDTNAFNYQAMQYWRNLAQGYEATARAALAEGGPDDR